MVTAYVELPVPDDIPSALEGCRLYTHAPDLDLRAPKASSSKPSSAKSTEGSSSKSPGGFQFSKALKGIKAEQGSASSTRGDGLFEGGAALRQEGNVVHLAPSALQGENALKTLEQLDALQKAAGRPKPAAQTSQAVPDVAQLAQTLSEASVSGKPAPASKTKVQYRHVHEAVQNLLDDVQDDTPSTATQRATQGSRSTGSQTQAAAPALPTPEYTLSQSADQSALELVVSLPGISGPGDAQVDIGARDVAIRVPGVYQPLMVALPNAVDDSASQAKWSKKKQILTLILPLKA